MNWIKLGKHQFNVEAIKLMSITEFKKQFKYLGDNAEGYYYKITGKKKSTKKKKDSE